MYNQRGEAVTNAGGNLVMLTPWPGMFRSIYKDTERYKQVYWSKFPNTYLAGDVSRRDADGYFWIQGRADDVLNVAGHRIGNSEVDISTLANPEAVDEIGRAK